MNFSYETLPTDQRKELNGLARRIKNRMRSSVEDLFSIGHDLADAKKLLADESTFLAWAAAEFSMPKTTVWRLTTVADRYYEDRASLAHLPLTSFYELSSPSLPEEIREKIEERVMEGEVVTAAEIQRLKRESASLRESNATLADQVADLSSRTGPTIVAAIPDKAAEAKLYEALLAVWRSCPPTLRERFFAEHKTPYSSQVIQEGATDFLRRVV